MSKNFGRILFSTINSIIFIFSPHQNFDEEFPSLEYIESYLVESHYPNCTMLLLNMRNYLPSSLADTAPLIGQFHTDHYYCISQVLSTNINLVSWSILSKIHISIFPCLPDGAIINITLQCL
eukprot:TRINITY_DN384_c0_g2_i4.p1 TRINITY_DN384_c0_g2~~TRINITY_DN384_c0_g2_i4.p1  ORF type:complete len:122 (-),score=2.31 TRINITY_DN384_c0_g2_i4:299-664(-)